MGFLVFKEVVVVVKKLKGKVVDSLELFYVWLMYVYWGMDVYEKFGEYKGSLFVVWVVFKSNLSLLSFFCIKFFKCIYILVV